MPVAEPIDAIGPLPGIAISYVLRWSCPKFGAPRTLVAKSSARSIRAITQTRNPYPSSMPWHVFLALALGVVFLLGIGFHRLLRYMSDQGLVDYLPTTPTKKSLGGAMMTFHSIYEPAVEHVIEYQRSGDLTIQTSGEPDPVDLDPNESPTSDNS